MKRKQKSEYPDEQLSAWSRTQETYKIFLEQFSHDVSPWADEKRDQNLWWIYMMHLEELPQYVILETLRGFR